MNIRRKYATEAHALSAIRPLRCGWVIGRQWLGIAVAFALPVLVVQALTGQTGLWHALSTLPLPQALAVAACLLVAYVYLACKQHALGIVMHDATHFRLLESRKRNDLVSNWLCAFPTGMVTSCYRRSHLPHHLFTNKPNDPYWVTLVKDQNYAFPKPASSFLRILLGDLFGLNLRIWWPTLRTWTGWSSVLSNREKLVTQSERWQFIAFWIGVAALMTYAGLLSYFLLLWVLPIFTLSLAFIRIRVVAEHDLDKSENELERTRHIDGNWFERLALAPLNINYHIAHHLFPSVPLYNLPKMHALLMQEDAFRTQAQRWKSYLGRDRGMVSSLLTR
ncbi:fatty acid desaturase family protein [Burkholderia alba]|uniref:fatty acid desaturase family protein n=1 Tax=Burkholderia alba TaxID=2683677 RepID=UPI002B05F958|nr:fatty acid desaturase family protein [Burkholderia alba]